MKLYIQGEKDYDSILTHIKIVSKPYFTTDEINQLISLKTDKIKFMQFLNNKFHKSWVIMVLQYRSKYNF